MTSPAAHVPMVKLLCPHSPRPRLLSTPGAGGGPGGGAGPSRRVIPGPFPSAGAAGPAVPLLPPGCAMGPMGGRGAAATPTATPAAVYRQFAQCIRTHGVPDFPDPVLD